MPEFGINKAVENNIQEIQKCSNKAVTLADETKKIAADLSEWGRSYSGIIKRLKALGNEVSKEGESLNTYSESGLAAVRLYFSTEKRICNSSAEDVVRVSASSSKLKTQEEIDRYINSLRRLLSRLLSFLRINKKTREKYMWYLEEYRQRLYDENDIDIIIIPPPGVIPTPVDPPVEVPAENPPAEEPPAETPPANPPEEKPPQEKPPVEKPPVETPPPIKETDRSPHYSNKLFDNKGQYGAKQRLNTNDKDLYEVIRMFCPDWTDKQCRDEIKRLGPEGCGYAAVANAILYAYEGRAEEFENVYGISMYKNGDLNYDELVMYIYMTYDDDTVEGITPGAQGDILDDMMRMGGHTMEPEYFYETTPENIPGDLDKGLLTFATQGSFDIEPVGGGKTLHYDEAHVMTVTGVAPDGRLIVSTWGGKYYIDPSTCYKPYYTLFKFDTRGNI